jgi:hypothetical protein
MINGFWQCAKHAGQDFLPVFAKWFITSTLITLVNLAR